jgi:DNA-binding transcriptional ArsR family regulator
MTPEDDLPPGSVEMRRRILLLVERYPGLHLREIQRRVGTSAMLAEYHLNILEKMGLVTSREQAGYRNFFPARDAALQLDETDRRWLSLLRRPVVLGMVLSLLETGPTRPIQIARVAGLPSSTAMYQIKVLREAGLIASAEDGATRIRLADPDRVLELLRAYHPVPDALTQFADIWTRAIQAFQAPEPPQPVAEALPPKRLPPAVAALPTSAQAVYTALSSGSMTAKDLCLETGLARRTVYTALQTLRHAGLLRERGNLQDMRQTRFWVEPPSDSPQHLDAGP